jgi:muramoyltetrapeptide carboxypeptidase
MIPRKLEPGEEVRVIAPSTSLHVIIDSVREKAVRALNELGLKVTYGARSEECDEFNSSSIEARLQDLHEAFADPKVKAILTALGGYNCNQLLRYMDFELIRAHPMIFCGYSDITALANAIHAKTGLVTYSGPHFSTFGMEKGLEYTLEYFAKSLFINEPFSVHPSEEWSDDPWYRNQDERVFIHNDGYFVINEGLAEGKLLGGNLCTLNLLQGTEFMPSLEGSILLLEDDYESRGLTFDRDLQSLLHQPEFTGVKGIVIGRFQKASEISHEKLVRMIKTKPELDGIPVIANADFGHTTPQFTFPVGGQGRLMAMEGNAQLEVVEH